MRNPINKPWSKMSSYTLRHDGYVGGSFGRWWVHCVGRKRRYKDKRRKVVEPKMDGEIQRQQAEKVVRWQEIVKVKEVKQFVQPRVDCKIERQQAEKVVKMAKEIVKVKEVKQFVEPRVDCKVERQQAEKVVKVAREIVKVQEVKQYVEQR